MFENFEGETVPKTSMNVRNSLSPRADEDRAAAALAAAVEPERAEALLHAVEAAR